MGKLSTDLYADEDSRTACAELHEVYMEAASRLSPIHTAHAPNMARLRELGEAILDADEAERDAVVAEHAKLHAEVVAYPSTLR